MKLPGIFRQRSTVSSRASDHQCENLPGNPDLTPSPQVLEGVTRADFRGEELLGRGGFGEVKLVRHVKTGMQYALKAVEKIEVQEREFIGDSITSAVQRLKAERDIGVMARKWGCPFIVELVAAFETEEKLYYVFEYCPDGEFADVVSAQPRGRLPEDEARFYVAEITAALEHLHAHGFVHRDVRAENILLKDGHAKLADFGCAKCVAQNQEVRPSCVFEFGNGRTQVYYPPEFCNGEAYGKDLDCWQLGILFFQIVTGSLPEASDSRADWLRGQLPANQLSAEAMEFCQLLTSPQRLRRLGYPDGASQLWDHCFFRLRGERFKQDICSRRLPAPALATKNDGRRRTRKWARPTHGGWSGGKLFDIPGFNFAAAMVARSGRTIRSFGGSFGSLSVRSSTAHPKHSLDSGTPCS